MMKKDDFSTSLYKAIKETISKSFKQTLHSPAFKEWEEQCSPCSYSFLHFFSCIVWWCQSVSQYKLSSGNNEIVMHESWEVNEQNCISLVPCCCDKMLDECDSRKEGILPTLRITVIKCTDKSNRRNGFMLFQSSRLQSIVRGKSWQQRLEAVVCHIHSL